MKKYQEMKLMNKTKMVKKIMDLNLISVLGALLIPNIYYSMI